MAEIPEDLYEILGVPRNASFDEIRKAHRKAAMKHHPDRGGDPEMFAACQGAYDILSDAEKRQLYDEGGMEAVESGFAGGDPFSALFKQARGDDEDRDQRNSKFAVPVELEVLYAGTAKELPIPRIVLCDDCEGTGSATKQALPQCDACDGNGAVIAEVQVFPGMFQRAQVPCEECDGQGKKAAAGDMCKECEGKTLKKIEEKIMVPVEKGMKTNDVIKIPGKGHQLKKGEAPGNLTLVVKEQKHDTWKRDGDDLHTTKTITLTEALCGFQFNLVHLDGHVLVVKSNPGDIVMDGSTVALEGEGMQMRNAGGMCGQLVITFKVDFPPKEFFDDDVVQKLRAILPEQPPVEAVPEGAKEMYPIVEPPGQREERKKERQGGAVGEDEEEEQGGVACGTQ